MTCSRDFDWDGVADDVVVPEQAAIAVYLNPKGDVVIRQAGQYGPDEDSWIVVARDRAPAVADAILRAAGLRGAQPDGIELGLTGSEGALPLLLENASGLVEVSS